MIIDKNISIVGVDLGGTKVATANVVGGNITDHNKLDVPAEGSVEEILNVVERCIEAVFNSSVVGIGVGVPSVVDIDRGIVYDVQNIPSWKEVHIKDFLSEKFNVPIYINNDANCFAAGEKHFGKGKKYKDFVGLILGTGMAGGLVVNNALYNGRYCGAGEFGMMPYKEHNFEYYCSGQFFTNHYQMSGADAFALAEKNDAKALDMWRTYGHHLGQAIKAIYYAVDPEIIILGGSISRAYKYFKNSLCEALSDFAYQPVLDNLKIEVSANYDIALLGAAALYHNAKKVEHAPSLNSV